VLTAVVGADVPTLLVGDPTRLQQVLFNLVGNAVKFTESGSVRVELAAEGIGPDGVETRGVEPDGTVRLRVSVRDTGIGIAPDALANLFRPFEQADGSTTRRFGGTGLGLAICARLVEAMGGEIGVESAPNEGSTFRFTLPLARGRPEAAAPVAALGRPSVERRALNGSRRVLLAEDSPVNRRVAVLMLEGLGYQADVVGDGRAAVEAAGRVEYDAVLMDCHMPVQDGYAAAAEIRAHEAASGGRRVPILALTAAVLAEDRARSIAAGMDECLAKPIRTDELASALARWIEPLAA